ncbi:MAG: outer membrane beta-barrel protein [Chitinophagaceae bacterium]
MQENKFENRVQRQMEEFRIRPSGAVWERVEEELHKKKKRRIVFYIFLMAGISLLGYSGYFLFNNAKPNLVHQNTSLPANNNAVKNNEAVPGTGNSRGKAQQHEKTNQLPFEDDKITLKGRISSTQIKDIVLDDKTNSEKKLINKKQERTAVNRTPGKDPRGEKANEDNLKNVDVAVTANSVQTREKLSLQKDPVTPSINKADISQPNIAGNLLVYDRQLPVTGKDILVKKDSINEDIADIKEEKTLVKTNAKKQVPSINWGVEFSAGISSNRENAFAFDGGQKSLAAADILSPPLNNTGGGLSPAIVYRPSSIQSSPAFRAGLVAEMKISKKSSVSSGLRYAYFSNSIKVGAYKDTIVAFSNAYSQAVRVDAIYRGYHEEEYTNRFHFIQLPLQYQLQLNKGVKLPITWNIGGSAGYLISTNGLVYDTTASGIYYHDDAAFNKFHWSLNTGLSFRFGSKNKIQWSLGPELSLGMNKLTKDDYTRKQYLLYGGLTGRVIFAKKK